MATDAKITMHGPDHGEYVLLAQGPGGWTQFMEGPDREQLERRGRAVADALGIPFIEEGPIIVTVGSPEELRLRERGR